MEQLIVECFGLSENGWGFAIVVCYEFWYDLERDIPKGDHGRRDTRCCLVSWTMCKNWDFVCLFGFPEVSRKEIAENFTLLFVYPRVSRGKRNENIQVNSLIVMKISFRSRARTLTSIVDSLRKQMKSIVILLPITSRQDFLLTPQKSWDQRKTSEAFSVFFSNWINPRPTRQDGASFPHGFSSSQRPR